MSEEHKASVYTAALQYLRRGWQPVPLSGKVPREKDWPNLRYTEESLGSAFRGGDNVGLILGEASGGLVDIDLDCPYAVALAPYILPPTPMKHGRKGSGISHWWYLCKLKKTERFKDPRPEKELEGRRSGVKGTIIEVRSTGGQTMVPPSIHPSGEAVAWVRNVTLEPAKVSAQELLAAAQRVQGLALVCREWGTGSRNAQAMHLGGWWAKAGVALEVAEHWIKAVCAASGDNETENRLAAVRASYQKLAAGEAVAGWQELKDSLGEAVLKAAGAALGLRGSLPAGGTGGGAPAGGGDRPAKGRTGVNAWNRELRLRLKLNDEGNAERFVKRHRNAAMHCALLGGWYLWDGKRWLLDESGGVLRLARQLARDMAHEALALKDDITAKGQEPVPAADARAVSMEHAQSTLAAPGLARMLELAASDSALSVVPDQLDSDAYLLNTDNCTLRLDEETVLSGDPRLPHDPALRLTKLAPVEYTPGAECVLWQSFLREVMDGDEAKVRFLQRFAGYLLFGGNSRQVIAFLYGTGANGKGVFLQVLSALLGDYAAATSSETIMSRESGSNNQVYALARLKGCRLAVISETDEGQRMAEALVKGLTGGDKIQARFSHGNFFEFQPELTPVVATNHLPDLRNVDEAMRRRVLVVPFTVTVPSERRDPRLPQRLQSELPGILNWALSGLAEYWELTAEGKNGLAPPESVVLATEEYFADQDPVRDFIDDCLELGSGYRALKGEVYKAYQKHCQARGCYQFSDNKLSRRLKPRLSQLLNSAPDQVEQKDHAGRWWIGVRITEDWLPNPENQGRFEYD